MKDTKTLFFLFIIGLLALGFDLSQAQSPKVVTSATQELTLGWDQVATDFPSLGGWTLFIRATSGGSKESQITIPYTGGTGPFTSTQTFTVTGEAGSVVRKYFVLDAVSKNGIHSDVSNEVFYDFQIPFGNVTVPLNLTVKVKVLVK